ncbi:hypothetical protein [Paenibacillus gansuensis]|uniref:Phage ABA sandwich domain-containing protein n=1 Tax=Paenibacillus gansuensis TaxID=306542 RepID=A0ABW5PG27_9BACL
MAVLMRDRLTEAEMRSIVDPRVIKRIRDHWGDPEAGELFIIEDQPGVFVITDPEYYPEDNDYCIRYDDAEGIRIAVEHNKALPLLSVAQMIDILSYDFQFQIQNFKFNWFIARDAHYIQGDDGDDLATVLMKAIKELLVK